MIKRLRRRVSTVKPLIFTLNILYCDRDPLDLRSCLIVFDHHVIRCEVIEIMDCRIQCELRSRILRALDQFFDDRDVSVIDMRVGDHVYEFSRFVPCHLCQHIYQDRVLDNVPVVCR